MTDLKRIVVGYHASQASLRALGMAKHLARELDAEVHVVHAVDLGDYPIEPDRADWEEEAQALIDAERDNASAFMGDYHGHWRYHTVRGNPYQVLCQMADRYDAAFIVIGTRSGALAKAERLAGPAVLRKLINNPDHAVIVVPTAGRTP